MATLPSKNALNDLTGGYYSYWTDGTTEGRATVAVLLGSTDAQAAAASLGSLALGTDLAVLHGGTGASTAEDARTNLGLVIGTNVQAYSATLDALIASPLTATTAASTYLTQASAASTYLTQATAASTYLTIASAASTYQPIDADLTAIAALNPSANNLIYKNGSDAWDVATITTFGRSLIDDANASTARSTLGLGNVENTALSTWAGSTSITTLGTITTGTVPAARVSAGTFQSGAFVFAGALSGITTLAVTTSATIASDLTLASGSITSASGAISFGNEALSTTGTFASGNATVTGTLGVNASTPDAFTISAAANVTRTIAMERSGAVRARIGISSLNSWYVETNGTTALALDSSQNATFAGKIVGAASTTSRATMNLPAGTAPTSPANGDIWSDGSDLFIRLGGTTYTFTKS